MTRKLFTLILIAGLMLSGCAPATPVTTPGRVDAATWDKFEAKLDYLRQQMKIPGMSAAVVMDQKLAWAKGFGYADLEKQVKATPDTPYDLASVTKTLAATIVMQLVEQGTISLDAPVSGFGVELESQGTILVRHLLTHTSTGVPGTTFIYDGGRYNYLGQIMERVTGKSFGTLLQERILDPLGMTNSQPIYTACQIALGQSPYPVDWEGSALQPARPYQLDPSYRIVEGHECGISIGAAGGLISTVVDLAKFVIALDTNVLLKKETKTLMLAPAVPVFPDRPDLAHGLGWFAQDYRGTRINWHAGYCPPSVSTNIIKVPEENLTLILMANTDHLNDPYPSGDITYHTMALAFYETFVYPRQSGKTVPEVNWEAGEEALIKQLKRVTNSDLRAILERELWAYRMLFASVGKSSLASQLLNVHQQVFSDSSPGRLDLFTSVGVHYYPPTVMTDQAQLIEAEQERLVGTYVLSDPKANKASLPEEVRFEVNHGKLFAGFAGGCVDLIAVTPTRFTNEPQGILVEFRVNGEAVERATVDVGGTRAVYLPKE